MLVKVKFAGIAALSYPTLADQDIDSLNQSLHLKKYNFWFLLDRFQKKKKLFR